MKRFLIFMTLLAMLLTLTACAAEEAMDSTLGLLDNFGEELEDRQTEDEQADDGWTEEEPEDWDEPEDWEEPEEETVTSDSALPEDGTYTLKDDVALYIYTYGHLPDNFITKKEAQALGWPGGELEPYAPGKCIGGDRFGNYEGLLPKEDGRSYTECDINTLGAKKRGAERIIFSNDGLIYYTNDHYESFELLYGTP